MCVGTNMCGHKRVWVQTCLITNVSGHKRVGTIVWAQVCMGTNVRSPKMYINKHCVSCLVVTCMLILLYNLEYLYVYVCKARYIYLHPFFSFSLSSYIPFFSFIHLYLCHSILQLVKHYFFSIHQKVIRVVHQSCNFIIFF